MDFPATVSKLCSTLEQAGTSDRGEELSDVDVRELRWGLGVLGRSARSEGGMTDLEAARLWADRHTF